MLGMAQRMSTDIYAQRDIWTSALLPLRSTYDGVNRRVISLLCPLYPDEKKYSQKTEHV